MAVTITHISVVTLCLIIPVLGVTLSVNDNSKIPDTQDGSNYPFNLVYLGTIDGKSYFADYDVKGNWTMAKNYCEAANLKLPSIDTENQAELLNRTLRQYTIGSYYWTSLHESRLPNMMVWDGTNNPPNTTFLKNWYWNPPAYQYCTLIRIRADNYQIEPVGCNYANGRVLCQT